MLAGVMYLIVLFLFIPVRYAELATTDKNLAMQKVILICAPFSIVLTSCVHEPSHGRSPLSLSAPC